MPNTLLLQEAREILSQYADVPLLKTDIPHRQVGADIMGQNLTLFDSSDRAAKYLASCYENLFKEVHFG
jgi:chromosome partitioning protein